MLRRALFLLILFPAAPAAAQTIITSAAPDSVSVSVFRDPNRAQGGAIDPDWLNGFALISETRLIDLPAGESVLRFEGVSEGMVAVSAIVTGLPGGVVQKNRDAALLSPVSLLDGTLGNRVHLRRTNRATGIVTDEEAIIRSGAAGAVILQTQAGFEALRCTGLPESLVYNAVPKGLSAKPTLSVTTRSPAAQQVTATLTYLSTGFDWASNYVARVAPDGKKLDLFAWLTVANSNGESFAGANLSALAGTINVESDFDELAAAPRQPRLHLSCFPTASGRLGQPPSPLPPPAAQALGFLNDAEENIIVTGSRRLRKEAASPVSVIASQEDLGDLKLYRVPIPVTVAANGQKQVALLAKDDVPFETIYRIRREIDDDPDRLRSEILLRMHNQTSAKLGVPLPSGQVAVFERAHGLDLLAGEGMIRDHAIGERVELVIGESSQVLVDFEKLAAPTIAHDQFRATVSNANRHAVTFELGFHFYEDGQLDARVRKLPRKDGLPTWTVQVPANATRSFEYRVAKLAN